MFFFACPFFLFFLLLPPALWLWQHRRTPPSVGVPSLGHGDDRAAPSRGVRISRLVALLPFVAMIALIGGLARPQWGDIQGSFYSEGVSMVLGVDISQSMEALDFMVQNKRVNRLEALRGVVKDFLTHRHGDRVGLVVFGSRAFTQLPLTNDLDALNQVLRRTHIGNAGPQTALGDALGIALKRLEKDTNPSKVVILLTDGQSNTGEISPEAAADIARKRGIRVYTIGMGSRGNAPYVVEDPFFGKQVVYRPVNIDEETLKYVAEKTGGLYFRGTDTEGLHHIYNTISEMEQLPQKEWAIMSGKDLYPWFLGSSLALLLLYLVLANTRYVRIPS